MPRVLQCCPGCSRQYEVGGLAEGSPLACSCGARFGVAARRAHAPRALCCSRCGGNLRQDARACEYCQAEITLEERRLDSICPRCFARMASDAGWCTSCGVKIEVQPRAPLPESARCPRCAGALGSRRVGGENLTECVGCAGLWLEPALVQRLCDDAEARKSVAEALGGAPPRAPLARGPQRAYIPCPACGEPMNRRNFGSISGILTDVCKDHGVWLDHGELARILAFAGRGGLVESRRRELSELERKQQRTADEAVPAGTLLLDDRPHGSWGRRPGGGFLGWLLRELLD